jgi:hypothetical protein
VSNIPWWGFVILAGLAWGVYVPLIFFGGTELTTRPGTIGGRLASILCVGVAYFLLAVVIPVVLMSLRDDAKPEWKTTGLIFSGLAGIAGAVGAICVIFASKAAVDTAKGEFETTELALVARIGEEQKPEAKAALEEELKALRAGRTSYLASYRIYIAPLIFALAPAVNTLVSLIWHPKAGNPWVFEFEMPGWKLPAGIVLVALGTFLVLMSKEEVEASKGPPPKPAEVTPAPQPSPSS